VPAETSLTVTAAVEGSLDQAILQRLVTDIGGILGPVHGRKGKAYLQEKIAAFNNAARFAPWVILVDLDDDAECAPRLCGEWLSAPSRGMLFSIAVHEVEAWLFGDPERLARFLGVSRTVIPSDPEAVGGPKRLMVRLASASRRREIIDDLIPRSSSGRTVGPGYSSRLAEFVLDQNRGWRPDVAAKLCPSLRRLMERLRVLARRPRK
jgi:hypothetical protein